MKRFIQIVVFLMLHQANADANSGMIKQAFHQAIKKNDLLNLNQWCPYPDINNRGFWDGLPFEIKNECVKKAEIELQKSYPPLLVTEYLEFTKSGNRSDYEDLISKRHNRLFTMVLAELIENKGRYINEIVNGIWFFCEETSWTLPAHLYLQSNGSGLPAVNEPVPDLMAGIKAAGLTWINHLLKPRLDSVSPLISRRIELEVKRRFVNVVFERNDFWWMGYSGNKPPNNWNAWIVYNYISCVLLLEKDKELQQQQIEKACEMLDFFMAGYSQHGGCDEGPSYWKHAVGSLFNALDLLYMVTDGELNLFDEKKVYNMGDYFSAMQISKSNFVNFADASRKIDLSPSKAMIYSFGQKTGNESLKNMAVSFYNDNNSASIQFNAFSDFGFSFLRELTTDFSEFKFFHTGVKKSSMYSWFPDIEVMTASENSASNEGFFIAAKGGHNAESHNHNDVGNFIIYHDGLPILIDVGVETYTKKTFSDERYNIWTMQSANHNLPLLNGLMQMNGSGFKAQNTRFSNTDSLLKFSLDIELAYPQSAFVKKFNREIIFKRHEHIVIKDSFNLSKVLSPNQWVFMSCSIPFIVKPGVIGFKGSPVLLFYSHSDFKHEIHKIELTDEKLIKSWESDALYKLVFTSYKTIKTGVCRFTFKSQANNFIEQRIK